MGLFEHFPYTNFHDLNLNWILGKIKDIDSTVAGVHEAEENAAASAEAASGSAQNAAESAEAASASAYAAAGSAEAAAASEAGAAGVVQNVSDRLTAFIQQHSGPSDETILFDIGSAAPKYNGTITLLDDPYTYQYIKFVWKHRHNICVQEFPVDMFEYPQNVYLRDVLSQPGTGGGSDLYEMCQISLGVNTNISNETLVILTATMLDNIGYATGDIISDSEDTGIIRVIGVKNVADTEVVDARVGSDGTIYPTLEDRLNAENNELKSQLTQLEAIPYEVKLAMDTLFASAAYLADQNAWATFHSWATSINVVSISAVFEQGENLIFSTDSLNDLKQYLTVTAYYDNGTSAEISAYSLSGELTGGTNTITVLYSGKTTTFAVNVIEAADITPDFNNFESADTSKVGWSYDSLSDALRVYTLPGKTAQYGQARCLFEYSSGKRVRITAKVIAVSGSEYTAVQNATQSGIIVSQTTSDVGSYVDGFVTIDFDPSDYEAFTNNQARIALYCTMTPASAGDVTWTNLKVIEYEGD